MKINLLQKWHDAVAEGFISGKIEYETFFYCEQLFLNNSNLFTIYLN